MKLRNKKTGEVMDIIAYATIRQPLLESDYHGQFETLAELNADWEDYGEPKESALDLMIVTLTNFIENEPDEDIVDLEECKQMLEKLKAWKRLKDKGLESFSWNICGDDFKVNFKLTNHVNYSQSIDDFEYIFGFGGEE